MAKRKKSRASQTSKGIGSNVGKSTTKALRRDYLDNELARVANQIKAFKKGKNVMLTIPNPNAKANPAKPFIRVNAKDVWRNPNEVYMMKS